MWWFTGVAYAARPFLPLESITWTIDVSGPIARVEVVERFRNTTDELVDAVYVFPLADGAAIDGLHMRIGTREIEGTIEARAQARAIYEAARAEGRTAALTEELRANVFTQDVANLPPGEAIEVRLSVVQPVAYVDDHWELTLPLVAPPRFVPLGSPTVLTALSAESPRDVGVRADVELRVQAGNAVRELWATPLPRDVRPDLMGSAARMSLDDLPLSADLVVGWKTRRDRAAAALLVSDTHVLLVGERGATEDLGGGWVDWGACPVTDDVQLPTPQGWYHLARRVGDCLGPVTVSGATSQPLAVWPRRAVDTRTLGSSWARAQVSQLSQGGGRDDQILALGLEYAIVTPQTSFVAVDTGGPVHAPSEGEDRWTTTPLGLEGGFFGKADQDYDGVMDELDAESLARGEPQKQFLQRIPTGRSYQSAIQTAAGVQAGSGGNPNLAGGASNENEYQLDGSQISEVLSTSSAGYSYDAIVVTDHRVDPGRLETPLRALQLPSNAGTNTFQGRLGAIGDLPSAPFPGGAAHGWVAGPIVRDHVWLSSAASASRHAPQLARLPTIDHLAADATLSVQVDTLDRIEVRGRFDRGAIEQAFEPLPFGSADGFARWSLSNSRAAVTLAGEADRVVLGSEQADHVTGAAEGSLSGSGHELRVGVEGGQWTQADAFARTQRWLATAWAGDTWRHRSWEVSGSGIAHQAGPVLAAAPRLSVALTNGWDRRLALSGGRALDPTRLVEGTTLMPSRWDADLALALGADTVFSLRGNVAQEQFPFVLPTALDPWPAGPVEIVDRVVPTLSAGLARTWVQRTLVSLHADFHPVRAETALLADPRAPFVPGFVDASRRWVLSGALGWELPTDPWTATLQVSASYGTEAAVTGQWWTRERLVLGADLDQQVPLRSVTGHVSLGAQYVRADLAGSPVAQEVLVLVPTDLGVWSPWRLHAAVELEF
jgi:hypothetical protein